MRKIASIAAVALLGTALAGCGKSEPAPEPTADAMASGPAMAAASAPAAVTAPAAGNYEITAADGSKSTLTVNADGSYSEKAAKGLPVAGLIKVTDGKVCFDPSGKTEASCYTESAKAADGSFTATDEKGVAVTVHPVAK
ncbi:MAG: hypothetical protein KGL44_11500 [Sphingomonadales bacterium]|nr:hypothetical protein [Sphingomonadales bacterium]